MNELVAWFKVTYHKEQLDLSKLKRAHHCASCQDWCGNPAYPLCMDGCDLYDEPED